MSKHPPTLAQVMYKMGYKQCNGCREIRTLDYFEADYNNLANDGLKPVCVLCQQHYQKALLNAPLFVTQRDGSRWRVIDPDDAESLRR